MQSSPAECQRDKRDEGREGVTARGKRGIDTHDGYVCALV